MRLLRAPLLRLHRSHGHVKLAQVNKHSNRGMGSETYRFLGYYDTHRIMTDNSSNRQTDGRTDRQAHREVSLPNMIRSGETSVQTAQSVRTNVHIS